MAEPTGFAMIGQQLTSRLLLAVTMSLLIGRGARGQIIVPPENAGTPVYQRFRYDEDYRYLRDPAKRGELWDPIKYIPLNGAGDWYLSLGGEARERYELYNNDRWNPNSPDHDGFLLQRYLLHADLHLGPSLRIFGQLQSCLEDWRNGGPRPIDEDRLDVHQLFVDVRLPIDSGDRNEFTLRVGRQEMAYGSARLIALREAPNIRQTFDAVKLLTRVGEWRVDAFLSRPVENDPGVFDDWGDDHINFWGVYATHPLPFLKDANIDLYYLGLDRPDARFVQGTADERRHSIGGRFFGKCGAWDYNFEGTFQWGTFGSGDIIAWSLNSDTGYTFESITTTPHVGLHVDVLSGDANPNDDALGTFNALFPKCFVLRRNRPDRSGQHFRRSPVTGSASHQECGTQRRLGLLLALQHPRRHLRRWRQRPSPGGWGRAVHRSSARCRHLVADRAAHIVQRRLLSLFRRRLHQGKRAGSRRGFRRRLAAVSFLIAGLSQSQSGFLRSTPVSESARYAITSIATHSSNVQSIRSAGVVITRSPNGR
jgi:Alginate export